MMRPGLAGARIGVWVAGVSVGVGVLSCLLLIPSDAWISARSPVPLDLDLTDRLRLGLGMAAMTFGADAHVSASGSGDLSQVHLSVGAVPTTVLLVALLVAVRGWVRLGVVRRRDRAVAAATAVLTTGVLMAAAAWPARATVGVDVLDLGTLSSGLSDLEVAVTPWSTGLQAAAAVALALGVAAMLGRWAPALVRPLLVLACSFPALGILTALAVLGTSETHGIDLQAWRGYGLGAVGWSGNLGVWAMAVGEGSRVGGSAHGSQDLVGLVPGSEPSWWGHLPRVISEAGLGWGLWVAVPLTALMLWAVARRMVRMTTPADEARTLAALLVATVVGIPTLVWIAGVHLSVSAEASLYGQVAGRADAGAALVETSVFTLGWMGVVGTLALLVPISRGGPSTPRLRPGSAATPPTG